MKQSFIVRIVNINRKDDCPYSNFSDFAHTKKLLFALIDKALNLRVI